jgi:hypothetical protein
MTSLSFDPKATLQFAASRHITVLFKEMLGLLETLANEHDEALSKLAVTLPAEYAAHLSLADWFTEEKAERLRKAVLGRGNDCKRAVLDEIDRYRIDLV